MKGEVMYLTRLTAPDIRKAIGADVTVEVSPEKVRSFLDTHWPGWREGYPATDYIIMEYTPDGPLMIGLDPLRKPGFLDINGERCYSACWL